MFKKLVSNLSFSPGIVSQMTFYTRRLARENLTRKLSAVLAMGVMGLQFAAVTFPPVASNAASSNDIIYGGFTDKANLLSDWDGSTGNENVAGQLRATYSYFGITRDEIVNSRLGTVDKNDVAAYSIGRNHYFAEDGQINVSSTRFGNQIVYLRPITKWDAANDFTALIGTKSDGSRFAIMTHCGNLVIWKTDPLQASASQTPTTPTPAAPILYLNKAARDDGPVAESTVKPGDIIKYRLSWSNTGGVATNVLVENAIPAHTSYVYMNSGNQSDMGRGTNSDLGDHTWWHYGNMPRVNNWYADLDVVVNDDVTNGMRICNTARIQADLLARATSKAVCHNVAIPAVAPKPQAPMLSTHPETPSTTSPATLPIPFVSSSIFSCTKLTAKSLSGTFPLPIQFQAETESANASVKHYNFDFGDNITSSKLSTGSSNPEYTYTKPGIFKASVSVSDGLITKTSSSCQVVINVAAPITREPKLVFHKSAINRSVQKNGLPVDANHTTANASDKIAYTLSAKNVGTSTQKDFLFDENITDILEYADLVDNGGAILITTPDKQQVLGWPAGEIVAGSEATKTFVVQIKNPIPANPKGTSDLNSYDLVLDNAFHASSVSIKLPAPVAKQVEAAIRPLPQTGGGLSATIVLLFVAISVFFYIRNRQLIGELKTLSGNYHPGALG